MIDAPEFNTPIKATITKSIGIPTWAQLDLQLRAKESPTCVISARAYLELGKPTLIPLYPREKVPGKELLGNSGDPGGVLKSSFGEDIGVIYLSDVFDPEEEMEWYVGEDDEGGETVVS